MSCGYFHPWSFMKDYNENSDKGCIFEVNVEYPKNVHNVVRPKLHNTQ